MEIGAGAHGKITRANTQQITRTRKYRNPKDYLAQQESFIAQSKIIKPQELPVEFMMNAMRLKNGVDQNLFFQTTGLLLSQMEHAIKQCEEKDLLIKTETHIKPTEMGFNFLNEILSEFTEENFPKLSRQEPIVIKEV